MKLHVTEVRRVIEHFVLRLILVEIGDTDTDSEVESGYEAKDNGAVNCPLSRIVVGNSTGTGKPGLTVYS
jgi:hypothetical protein